MIAAVRQRVTYSNVIATMALFIALGGVAVAAGLPRNSVGTKQLKRGAVTSAKLGKKSVIAGKLGPNSVGPGNIGNGAITTAKLGAGSVIASTIKNSVVTTNKLNNEAVTAAKLGKESVTTAKLGKEAATTAKLDNESVTSAKLGKGSVTAAKLSNDVGPLLGTLKSGQTLQGVFDMGSESKSARGATSFQFPLLNIPGISPANILKSGQTTAACPGVGSDEANPNPRAAAGQLCIYIRLENGLSSLTLDTVNRLGFGLAAFFTAAAETNEVSGTWAVTAP